jgi:hypothetical protein
MMYGLWRRRACHPHTRIALSLLQLGYLDKAQLMFSNLCTEVAQNTIKV